MKDDFLLMPVSIEDMEGQENFAALIIRKDNPKFCGYSVGIFQYRSNV